MKKVISGLEDRAEEIIEEATGREKQEEMEKKLVYKIWRIGYGFRNDIYIISN